MVVEADLKRKRLGAVRRYANLIRRIRNWPAYFLNKFRRNVGPGGAERYVTRRKRIAITVPRSTRGVFKEIFMSDEYDARGLFASLPRNAVIVDVGANVGIFAAVAAEFADCPTIVAVEPLPANLRALKQNLAAIPPRVATVHCVDGALTGRPRSAIVLHHTPDDAPSVIASTQAGFSESNASSVSVRAVTLGELMRGFKFDRVDLLKLDCEGAEFEIFRNTPREVFEHVDRIVAEVHELDSAENSFDRMAETLRECGFEFRSVRLSDGLCMVWATR